MTPIILALIGLIQGLVIAVSFTLIGRSAAKEREAFAAERQFLVNAALSNNSYEFAQRQLASSLERPVDSEPEFEIVPEGL